MKNIIITGATGMIGKLLLEVCLQRMDVNKVTSITRRAVGIQHPKLLEVVHDDFLDFSKIETHFKNQDICFFCIGVYTGQVSKEEFKKITVDYTKAFAETLRRNSDVSFCFLSGAGADSKEKSKIMFAKDKGIAENILLNLKFKHTYIFRPGYIYPVIQRIEPNRQYILMRKLYKFISIIYPNIGLTSNQLVSKMIDVAFKGGDKNIYENKDIKE